MHYNFGVVFLDSCINTLGRHPFSSSTEIQGIEKTIFFLVQGS